MKIKAAYLAIASVGFIGGSVTAYFGLHSYFEQVSADEIKQVKKIYVSLRRKTPRRHLLTSHSQRSSERMNLLSVMKDIWRLLLKMFRSKRKTKPKS